MSKILFSITKRPQRVLSHLCGIRTRIAVAALTILAAGNLLEGTARSTFRITFQPDIAAVVHGVPIAAASTVPTAGSVSAVSTGLAIQCFCLEDKRYGLAAPIPAGETTRRRTKTRATERHSGEDDVVRMQETGGSQAWNSRKQLYQSRGPRRKICESL